MRLVKRKAVKEVVELNITAFLNLMVILVPFLLITAVFSRITILELNLPSKDAKATQLDKIKLQLELVMRPNSFEIRDFNLGQIKYIERDEGETDWQGFTNILVEIKSRFPDEKSITLLVDQQVTYKTIIQVMDRVASAEIVNVTELETVELFPNISIGDAPVPDPDAEASTAAEPSQAAEQQ